MRSAADLLPFDHPLTLERHNNRQSSTLFYSLLPPQYLTHMPPEWFDTIEAKSRSRFVMRLCNMGGSIASPDAKNIL
jgi:hypothetical protein